jgi:hypothetical protein
MDRVVEWYKRRIQLWLLIIGLVAAVLVNAGSIDIVRAHNSDRSLRNVVAAQAIKTVDEGAKPTPATSGLTVQNRLLVMAADRHQRLRQKLRRH